MSIGEDAELDHCVLDHVQEPGELLTHAVPLPVRELRPTRDRVYAPATSVYSHVYSHGVGTSRDEGGRAGTTKAENVRECSKSRAFTKVMSHLENRCGRKLSVVRIPPLRRIARYPAPRARDAPALADPDHELDHHF